MNSKWIHRSILTAAAAGALALSACGGSDSGPADPGDDGSAKPGHVYNYAGTGAPGYGRVGQAPAKTELYWPQDVVFSPDGSPFVLDWNNHRVIAVDKATGQFELIVGVAGGDFGDPCPAGGACTDVLATDAKLNHPTHVAFDANGDMVLCAWHNSMLMLLDMSTGLMDRFCGTGARSYNGEDRPASTALVDLPVAVVFDAEGRLYFGDQANMVIRMIDEAGIIHTVAGTQPVGTPQPDGSVKYTSQPGFSGDEGPATEAKLRFESGQLADPSGKICFDGTGNLYIADTQNHCVRMVDAGGIIHRFAGVGPSDAGFSGDDGPATSAQLNEPRDVAADANGNIFIADTGNHLIRMVRPDGTITTVAGKFRGVSASPLGPYEVRAEDGAAARDIRLTSPFGVAVDDQGRLWISDTLNSVVRILYR